MRTVWTGFEAFGEHEENPSWMAARGAAEAVGDELETAVRLPVVYEEALEWVERELAESTPFLAVQFGLAASREAVSLERVGRRRVGDRDDEAGSRPDASRLGGEEVASLETPLDVEALVPEIEPQLELLPVAGVRVSEDAGAYVCNALYYRSLAVADEGSAALFVHIPEVDKPAARDIGRAVGRAVVGS